MADELPEPFVSADHDVRSLDGFMLNVERLLASELVAIGTPEECWAAFMLWCRAWKQVPGGSLPNDDKILAGFSGTGRRWKQLKAVALHGFVLCSDGRLYHRFLCGEVKRAYKSHIDYVTRRENDKKRISEWREKRAKNAVGTCSVTRTEHVLSPEDRDRDRDVRKERKKGSDPNGSGAGAPPDDPVKAIFDRGVAILGEKGRSLIGKARQEHGELAVLAAITACEDERPSEPAAFFVKCLAARAKRRENGGVIPMHPGAGG